MKFMKYLVAFALALCASANVSHAQTVQYLATGSSALFLELGQAAANLPDTGCYWTNKTPPGTSTIAARDPRVGTPGTDEAGAIWITWGKGAGTCAAPVAPYNIYAQMNLDSVLGDRCFFMVDSTGTAGCIQIITVSGGTAGANQLGTGFTSETPIPGDVVTALNGKRIFVAATDIRPEDAKFASARMFTPCGQGIYRNPYLFTSYQTAGLGYQTATTGVGTDIVDIFAKHFHVLDFNISGSDPITGHALPSNVANYTVSTVGAQPIVVVVSHNSGDNTGVALANDIPSSTLMEFLIGGYGRATDLIGPTAANPVTAYIREPLSGTYNTMEYSNPNSNQFKNSQDLFNCSGATWATNPMNIPTAFGAIPGASKQRVIGTGNMITALKNHANGDSIGYFFWSAANASGFDPTTSKYLTVSGVDPLADNYSVTNGVLPGNGTVPLTAVTFKNLNAGDYSLWSALRLVSVSPTPAGVTAVINGAQTLSSTQNDFIPVTSLKVWKSHFNLLGLGISNNSNGNTVNPATPGDLCGVTPLSSNPEGGGDAGGSTVSIQGNHDFCADFSTPEGITDKNN